MKKIICLAVALTCAFLSPVFSQQKQAPDSLGLPGDNLNLYAVMKIFRESKTLEEFERKLNDKENHINNLDLNNDNKVDYITVTDHQKGDAHNIVLQVSLSAKEKQDVAVFNVEKNKKGEVTFDLVGDEDLYGKDYVIEPNYFEYPEGETPNPAYQRVSSERQVDEKGNVTIINNYTKTEVAEWPMMMYLYGPRYSVWMSPWYWDFYPPYWYPWEPWYWHMYYGWHVNFYYVYYGHYHHSHHYGCPITHQQYYHNIRAVSPVLIGNIRSRAFEKTYSRPESRSAGSEIFFKEVESRKIIMPERAESLGQPPRGEKGLPELKKEKAETQVPGIKPLPEEKRVTPGDKPEIREVPRQNIPDQPRMKERPGKERDIRPVRERKPRTSSVKKENSEKGS